MKNPREHIDPTNLYESIRRGDEAAFSRYYESTMPWLVPLIQRIVRDSEESWNIAQDTFTKLWQQREHIDPQQSLDGYVARMANNAALNLFRRKQYHYEYSGEQMYVQSAEDHAADAPLLASEMESLIEYAIRNMPPQRRMAFELSRVENLTYNEIAERMELSVETVRRHMKLALKVIRDTVAMILIFLFL